MTQLGPYGISTAVRRILPQINEIVAKFKTSSISNEKLPVYDDPDYNFDGPDYKMTDELAKSYSEVMRLMWDDEKNRKDLKEDDNIDFQQIAEEYTKSKIEEIDTEIKKIDEQLKKSGIDPDKAENSSSEEDDGKDTKDKKDDDKDSVGSLSKRKTALAKIKEQCEKIVADPLKIELYLPVPTIAFGITQRVMTAISDASKNDANSEKNIAS